MENKKEQKENNWHNVTDPEWEVIANAFKSYTIEGAVERLKYQGYKVIKSSSDNTLEPSPTVSEPLSVRADAVHNKAKLQDEEDVKTVREMVSPTVYKCPTCGESQKAYESSQPTFCSNSFHLSPTVGQRSAEEVWKNVYGYDGLYQVSNLGNVKALAKTYNSGINGSVTKRLREKILKQVLNKQTGYRCVNLFKEGVRRKFTVHRLVALAFLGDQGEMECVNHKDSNRQNNRVDNLEWTTYQENVRHSFNSGKRGDFSASQFKSSEIELLKRNEKIGLLENYSTFLAANGYMDEDWRSEPPYAIDEFLKLTEK